MEEIFNFLIGSGMQLGLAGGELMSDQVQIRDLFNNSATSFQGLGDRSLPRNITNKFHRRPVVRVIGVYYGRRP